MNGVLVVDKPMGPTSHDIVDGLRRLTGERRAGHTGTLDPFATGVLPVCLGKATRLVRFLAEGDKLYRALIHLGYATTTDDLTGQPLGPPRPVTLDPEEVKAASRAFVGEILQHPPAFSAKRVGGRRLYEMAREGRTVETAPSRVRVHSLEVLGCHADLVEIEVRCSPGTYIRALARDLGRALEVGGHLAGLRRKASGPFGLDRAVAWEPSLEEIQDKLLPLSEVLQDMPAVAVGAEGAAALRHGRDLDRRLVTRGFPETPPPRVRVLDDAGSLLALAVPRGFGPPTAGLPVEPVLHPDVVLAD